MGSIAPTRLASIAIFLALPPGALAGSGVDFSNNLFSDLGPVLALFGEQVARQFLSQSMSWLEDMIFAMAPPGITTAIISAVRVGGPIWLKAVVGRARESAAVAEMELMSSTSHEVCELWNGEAIVRVMGSPDIAEILCLKGGADGKDKLFTLRTAKDGEFLRNANELREDGGAPDTKKNAFLRIFLQTFSKSSSANLGSASTDAENATKRIVVIRYSGLCASVWLPSLHCSRPLSPQDQFGGGREFRICLPPYGIRDSVVGTGDVRM
ncbi:hypothetical protein C7212DRAFT_362128 [Tuber magnatum]|uniref:Uncharacterized protein n=1 Tax=Tuber magnatum TaxID=42249 RepID=A0A317T0Q3_9PEZI|nr:hypothetical protein C7212DRAFT_362128 [Tuber magnatum]